MDVDGISIARALEIENASIVSGVISPITGHLILTTAGGAEIDAGLVTTESFEGTLAEFNAAMTDADFVSIAGVETLTNKTLTAPTISSPVITGIGKRLFVNKSADELVTSSTTLQDDNELLVPLEANAIYLGKIGLDITGVSGGIKVALSPPAGTVGRVATLMSGASPQYFPLAWSPSTIVNVAGGATDDLLLDLYIKTSATAGNLILQWAQNSSNATATQVKENSYIDLTRVA